MARVMAAAVTLGALVWGWPVFAASLGDGWVILNGTAGTHLATGNVNRCLAYSAPSNLLYVVNNGVDGDGTSPAIDVFDGTSGWLLGNANVSGVSGGTFLLNSAGVADDGVLYSANLSTAISSTPFTIYCWTNYSLPPAIAYSGNPAAGLALSGSRMGDVMAVRGSGTGTVLLAPIESGVTPTTNVVLFSTGDGVHFTNTVIGIAGLPALVSGGGGTFGASFYTNNTFLFKPSGSSVYLVQFPAKFASSAGTLVTGVVISTNPLPGGTVVLDCNADAGLTAALGTIPNAAPAVAPVSLYAAPPLSGFATAIAATDAPHNNSNGNFAGSLALGGAGKTNSLYSLDCNNGVYCWRIIDSNSVAETGTATPAGLQVVLNTNVQGAVVNLYGVDPLSCPGVSMSQTWSGGKLIFSDSPESPTNNGILYEDTNLPATGSDANRVFVYHVNENPSGPMKFSILVKNNGTNPAVLTVQHRGVAGPGGNYPVVGQTAFYRWLTNATATAMTVAPGQIVRLDTNFDSLQVADGALINGIWDYTFTQPHTIIVCVLEPLQDPVAVGPGLALLPRDIHDRGTFANCNKSYETSAGTVIDTAGGVQEFPLGGNADTYVTGYDNSVSPPVSLSDDGNYGVVYTIDLKTASSDGRALALLANPQGGSWSGALETDPGILPGGAFVLPLGASTISSPDEAAVAGEYFPNGGKTIQLQFMPTGASSFPLLLLAAPFASTAPDLLGISNDVINAGQTVNFTASVSGGVRPFNFRLPLAPAGASVSANTGTFNWRAPVSDAGTTQNVQLAVSDSDSPSQSDRAAFQIQVNPLRPATFVSATVVNGEFQAQLEGAVGPDYVLQTNTNLANVKGWVNVCTSTPAVFPYSVSDSNAPSESSRYYRVSLAP